MIENWKKSISTHIDGLSFLGNNRQNFIIFFFMKFYVFDVVEDIQQMVLQMEKK